MASISTGVALSPSQEILIDQVDANTMYIGVGKLGATQSAASWQIRKVLTASTVTSIQYANGSRSYNQIWNNRAALSYS